MVVPVHTRMTAAEFFDLPETNQPTELLDGELIVSPSPVPEHQFVSGDLYSLVKSLVPNGRVIYAPIDVYFDDNNIVQPDILWVAEDGKAQITQKYVEGPPALIIEIFSPGTAKRDKREKYNLYQKHGVPEYWMVDPVGQYVEVCIWEEGTFKQHGVYGPEDTFASPVLGGKTVDLKTIFSD